LSHARSSKGGSATGDLITDGSHGAGCDTVSVRLWAAESQNKTSFGAAIPDMSRTFPDWGAR
jgi:hypothetical protein